MSGGIGKDDGAQTGKPIWNVVYIEHSVQSYADAIIR